MFTQKVRTENWNAMLAAIILSSGSVSMLLRNHTPTDSSKTRIIKINSVWMFKLIENILDTLPLSPFPNSKLINLRVALFKAL